ncbi:hypothetical protein L914_19395 [Phytophthora nicotianae]|uniref:Uncharacterized protein n=1 Tax=Phytophthora nicotianae TaxID=4792 RepID=W2MAH5_PHYNI|nr:hypothetical protein L914_19395 [Phytophthora nicotianae]
MLWQRYYALVQRVFVGQSSGSDSLFSFPGFSPNFS